MCYWGNFSALVSPLILADFFVQLQLFLIDFLCSNFDGNANQNQL